LALGSDDGHPNSHIDGQHTYAVKVSVASGCANLCANSIDISTVNQLSVNQ